MPNRLFVVAHRATSANCVGVSPRFEPWRARSAVEAGDGGAVFADRAVEGGRVEGVHQGAAGGGAGGGGEALAFAFRDRGVAAAALDREVADAVASVDHVVAAVAEEAVAAGLAEHRVLAGVADQDVVVEGALHVLVGR